MPAQKLKLFARGAATGVLLVSLMVLCGWTFELAALKSLISGWPKVSPLTMLGLFLAASSLWCASSASHTVSNHPEKQIYLRISQLLALLLVLLGAIRLGDYAWSWNLNADLLGFQENLAAGERPARMAPVTALAFFLIGSALLFANSSRSYLLFQFMVMLCGLLSWLGLSHYLYGGVALLPYAHMSFLTAFCFLLLCAGTFALRTDAGLMALVLKDGPGGRLIRLMLPPAILLTFAIGWLLLNAQKAGWFGSEAGLSLFALSNVILFVLLAWDAALLLNRVNEKQQEANLALRENEARLKQAQHNAHIGSWHFIPPATTTWSDEMYALFQLPRAEPVTYAAILSRIHPEDKINGEHTAFYEAFNSDAKDFDAEYRLIWPNGQIRWVHAQGLIERKEDGSVIEAVGTMQDVTERKTAEIALRKSQSLLRIASRAAKLGGWTVAMPEVRITWSDEVCAIHDMPPGTIPTLEQAFNFYAPQSRPRLREAFSACMQQGIAFDLELEFVTATGRNIWVRSIGEALRDKNGTITSIQGAFQEITERKQAENEIRLLNAKLEQRVIERTAQLEAANAELSRSRAELKSLFESLPGLYLVLTPDLHIVSVSDAYLKATMTTREGIIGRGLFEVFPDNPDDRDANGVSNLRASLNRVLKNAAPDTMAIQKYDVRRPDGVFEEHYWSPINSPVFGADREIKYIVHRVEEVTDYVRQKSSPNAESGGEFSARLQQMEAEVFLSTKKLQEANLQLQAANQELEAFSYSISHDLRAPLRAVDGYSQAVLEDFGPQLPEEGRRQLQVISDNAQRMGELIDDLLSFSRLSRQALNKQSIDTETLVRTTLTEMETTADEREIDIRIAPLPPCEGDPGLLKQVWVNLLSNALKYSRKRQQAIIEIGCIEQPNEVIYFVRDNGSGFDMHYADKLFGVFQRLHRVEDYEGTGVGLAIVQRIVHRHGGRIWAEAAIDQGATFYFTLKGQA